MNQTLDLRKSVVAKSIDCRGNFRRCALFGIASLLLTGLTGCLVTDVTHRKDFVSHANRDFELQKTVYLYRVRLLNGGWWPGSVEIYGMSESIAKYIEEEPIEIAAGAKVRISKIERRNLIDSGIEYLAFGKVWHPETGEVFEFYCPLDAEFGAKIRRAPWEDESVPELRPAVGSEWVGIHVVPPSSEESK